MSLLQKIFEWRHAMKVSIALILVSLFLTVAPVQSQEFSRRFYLNGGVGLTQVEPVSPTDALKISDNSDAGGHLAVGFDVSRFLSIEGYAATLGSAEVEFLGTNVGSVDYTVFGLSALGYLFNSRSGLSLGDDEKIGLFLREGASVYGRFGVGHMQNDSTQVEYRRDYPNHAVFGLGLEYGFANGIALRTEFMGMDTDARYVNIGILKRFGSAGRAEPVVAAAIPAVVEQVESAPKAAAPSEPKMFKALQAPYIYFGVDDSVLTAESEKKLDGFAEQLKDSNLDLMVEGHTDWIAREAYNMSLSVRRAESVANYLESKGISRERMTTVGYGEKRPISNNDTFEGRALNRRTEIQLQ